jgi:hypothetical protein
MTVAVGWKGLDTVELLDAGVTHRSDGVVRVPYRDETGTVLNSKLFGRRGSWWEQRGLGVMPFGLERITQLEQRCRRQIWIAEGESDALALREHYAEWRGLPVDVIGLPGAGTWREEWARHLTGYAASCCFPDGDQAGERMADRITTAVGWAIRVRLPAGRDVRDVLQHDGPEALNRFITRAEECAVLLAGMRLCSTLPALQQFLSEVSW